MRDVCEKYNFHPGEYYCYRKDETVVLLKITEVVGGTILCQYISKFRGICIIRDRMKIPVEDLPLLVSCSKEIFEKAHSMIVQLYGQVRSVCQKIKFLKKVRKVEVGDCFLDSVDTYWCIMQIRERIDEYSTSAICQYVSGTLDRIEVDTRLFILDDSEAYKMRRIDPEIIEQITKPSRAVFREIRILVDDRLSLCKKYS